MFATFKIENDLLPCENSSRDFGLNWSVNALSYDQITALIFSKKAWFCS